MQAARARGFLAQSIIRDFFTARLDANLSKTNPWIGFCTNSPLPGEKGGPQLQGSPLPESAEGGVSDLAAPSTNRSAGAVLQEGADLSTEGLASESQEKTMVSMHENVTVRSEENASLNGAFPDDMQGSVPQEVEGVSGKMAGLPDLETPPPPEYDGEPESLREVRLSNASMWGLKGQVVSGEVIAVGKEYVVVDLGYKSLSRFFKKELSTSQIYAAGEGHKVKRAEGVFFKHDQLRFRVEDVESPYGDMHLTTYNLEETIRKDLVWKELREAFTNNVGVQGRVLNIIDRGYAVGIGGYVCFCPSSGIHPGAAQNIGVLQMFKITRMVEETKAITVMSWENTGFRGPRSRGWV